MPISRQFEIVYLLLNQKQLTSRELAGHFEVSVRTIMRDIDSIITAGIPIVSNRGRNGGIAIDEGYVLDKSVLTIDEQNQIILALQSLMVTENPEVEETLHKFRTFFASTNTNWLEIDFSRWGKNESDHQKFEKIKTSIINNQALYFLYYGTNGSLTKRNVYPLKLIFKGKNWYLQGYCLKETDYRLFKISRIIELEVKKEKFDIADYDILQFESNDLSTSIDLVLKFDSCMTFRVLDEFDYEEITKNDDGSILVNTKLPLDNWLCSFLLSFGKYVEVIQPLDVKDEIIKMAKEIIDVYNMT